MFDFPLCQVHVEGNWFLAILVGTNLGGLMAKEDTFIWGRQLEFEAGKIMEEEDEFQLPYLETVFVGRYS